MAEDGKPYLDGINFPVIPSEESRAAQMLQGDAQVMIWPGETSEAEFDKSDVAKVRLAPKIWTASFYFNLPKPVPTTIQRQCHRTRFSVT